VKIPWGTVISLPSTVRVMSAWRADVEAIVLRSRRHDEHRIDDGEKDGRTGNSEERS
jgi:hypothetical protein